VEPKGDVVTREQGSPIAGDSLKGTNQKVLIMPLIGMWWKILSCVWKRIRNMKKKTTGPQKRIRSK
jgi:hypothetical protein